MVVDNIPSRISKALDRRRSQRGFVEQLVAAQTALESDFEALVGALEESERSVRALSNRTSNQTKFADSISALLSGSERGHMGSCGDLRRRLAEAGDLVSSVQHRVQRDTVNLGVVGTTKSGKSTLLRTITGLPESVIPSSAHNPTTAAPSRIYHVTGEFTATVDLHNWGSFRDSYLTGLHHASGLDPVPTTAAEFRGYRYPPLTKVYGDQRYVDKLRIAQATFAGYEGLLHRSEPLHLTQFDLRPYVAYPLDAGSTEESRPYHAVKSVRIEHRFPNLNVRDLGLIDLPGSGEAGLDVDKQFLNQLKNESTYC